MTPPVKQTFLERAKEVYRFHAQQLSMESSWTVQKTAVALNRSIGSVSQDIVIGRWSFTHQKQLERCGSQREALEFIREKDWQMRIRLG